jgi:hypothetical protein
VRVAAEHRNIAAAPGSTAVCRVWVLNDTSSPANYRARIVGLGDHPTSPPAQFGIVAPGDRHGLDLPIQLPDDFPAGEHELAVEVTSDRPGDRPVLSRITVRVGAIDDITMAVTPSTTRGRRSGKFHVDVHNRDDLAIEVALHGEGPELAVDLVPPVLVVPAQSKVRARGRVRGPRRILGDPIQHQLTISATSTSAPAYASATYLQKPLLPRTLRLMTVMLVILGLWVGVLAAGVTWWRDREQASRQPTAPLVDTDGDGKPDTRADVMLDTNGDGKPDTLAAAVAEKVAADAAATPPETPIDERRVTTIIAGTVKAGETGDNAGITVTRTEIELGGPTNPRATLIGSRSAPAGKLWPARFAVHRSATASGVAQTESVRSTTSDVDGAWQFGGVPIRQSYELHFAKVGFDSQAFVITPPEDGEPVELDVVLQPARGALGGIVVGAGGGLGGAEIVVTDGTLTFSTTTSTREGERGRWTIPRVSTPGVYTITATLRGYGTEVVRVTLGPGDVRDDITIRMRSGVGSIIGTVRANGRPLGGVTLTASNGDLTRTTTTLTEGPIGTYSFPQLPIPAALGRAVYTVTASAPGYVTQTLQVDLRGAVAGVDFTLVRTTSGITGTVVSDRLGPLPGALITVSRDDLVFRTSSASVPLPGAFSIDDLPPGTYLVEATRFDHATASQLVTVDAGRTADVGVIRLTFTGRPPVPSTGSIVVEVVDALTQPLFGTTVTVTDIADGRVVASGSDPGSVQNSFRFENIPVGTYMLTATKPPVYRPAEVRVSVGLGEVRRTLTMFKNGQVSGSIVDSITGLDLDDYEVTIFRLANRNDPVGQEVVRATVPDGKPANTDGRIVWETPADPPILITGLYRVEVSRPPPGYAIVNDQVLDDALPTTAPRTMRFEILPEIEDPLRLNDIEADPYPTLRGRVYIPQLRDAAGNVIDFDLREGDMTVTLNCPGGTATDLPADLIDEPGTPTATVETYFFSRGALQTNNMLGACTLRVVVNGFEPVVTVIDPPLAVSNGVDLSDQIVNVAVRLPVTDFGGQLYWLDRNVTPNRREPAVEAIRVASTTEVIIGFVDGTGSVSTPPRPIPAPAPLSSDVTAGNWGLPGQVFGQTDYLFSNGPYAPGTIRQTLDENGRVVAIVQNVNALTENPDGSIDLELQPRDGSITGRISVVSTNPANFDGFTLTTSTPNGSIPAAPLAHTGGGVYTQTRSAGRWNYSIAAPPNHVLFDADAAAGPLELAPGGATSFSARYYAQAEVRVLARDATGAPASGTATLTSPELPFFDGAVLRTLPAYSATVPIAADGTATFAGVPIPVRQVNSSTFDRGFSLSLTLPGLDADTGSAAVTVNGTGGGTFPGLVNVPLNLAAGTLVEVTATAQRFGTVAGSILGEVGSPTNRVAIPVGAVPPPTITARRVLLLNGLPLGAPEAPVAVFVDPLNANGFAFAGPPGYYTLDVTHPHYQQGVYIQRPTADTFSIFVLQPLYRMENQARNPTDLPFVLAVERGTASVTVLESLASGSAVPGALVTLTKNGAFVASGTTGNDGIALINGLVPDTYRIEIRKKNAAGDDANFPVILTGTVPFGADPAARTLDVAAAMPPIGGAINGSVRAVNAEGDLVPLPASVVVTRSFTVPGAVVEGTPTANQADEGVVQRPTAGNPVPTITVTPPAPPGTPATFSFLNLAAGQHTLSYSAATGYTAPANQPVTVVGVGPSPAPVASYLAANRQVVVRTTSAGAALDGAVVRLVSPDVGETPQQPVVAGNVHTFGGVFPEIAAYTITVTRDLYTSVSTTVPVPPGTGDIVVDIAMSSSDARIRGTALREDAPGTPPTGAGGATINIYKTGVLFTSVTANAAGEYAALINETGNYTVEVVLANYATRATTTPIAVVLGQEYVAATVTVPRLATIAITVNGPTNPALSAVTVVSPAGIPAATRSGNVFTFSGLDPDLLYQFRATSTGFISAPVPTTGSINPAPGQNVTQSVTLVARVISGTVTSGGTGVTGVTVIATSGATTLGPVTTVTGGGFSINQVPVGTWTVVAELLGTGRATATAAVANEASPSVTGLAPALTARTVTVTFTLTGAAGSVSASIDGGTAVNGTSPGTAAVTTLESAARSWRIEGPTIITRTGVASLAGLTNTTNLTALAVGVPVTISARPTVTGTVTRANGNAVQNGDVFICASTVTTCDSTTDIASGPVSTGAGGAFSIRPDEGTWIIRAVQGNNNFSPPSAPFTITSTGTGAPGPISLVIP